MSLLRSASGVALAAAVGLFVYGWELAPAEACGCLSPPVPDEFDDSEFAVNQQSEQIIFEVEDDGFVTAHVLIRYAGRPENFAWIVPAPSVPDFAIGSDATFGMLDGLTAPIVNVAQPSLCPDPAFRCEQHDFPRCPLPSNNNDTNGGSNNQTGGFDAAPGNGDPNGMASNSNEPPVEVLKREQVGDYETVVFTAEEAMLAIGWLNDNGFIVNDTMTPYMQPYLDAGMVFVASKLVAGATSEQIKPLKMRYQSTKPMIPLQLTAVAAEPHLTVTAYIVSDGTYFAPENHPVVAINPSDISTDDTGRVNYPMVMSRVIDEAGGDGFVIEYAGSVPTDIPMDDCCSGGGDFCGVGFDGICQCPLSEFDAEDCGDTGEDFQSGFELLQQLSQKYTHLSRITTRLSPEEMTFDPVFAPATTMPIEGRLRIDGQRRQMWGCEADIIDRSVYDTSEAAVACAATYCGRGICAVAGSGEAGCVCEPGFAARQFTDLDGAPSVTCVPEIGTVDLAAGGLDLPTACKPTTCGSGDCVDIGGFASCACGDTALATPDPNDVVPACLNFAQLTGDSGARDYTTPMEDVRACAPAPGDCGEWGWLVDNTDVRIEGVLCPSSLPSADRFDVPSAPTCDDIYPGYSERYPGDRGVDSNFDGNNTNTADDRKRENGCGGCATPTGGAGSATLMLGLLGMLRLRRRRSRKEVS